MHFCISMTVDIICSMFVHVFVRSIIRKLILCETRANPTITVLFFFCTHKKIPQTTISAPISFVCFSSTPYIRLNPIIRINGSNQLSIYLIQPQIPSCIQPSILRVEYSYQLIFFSKLITITPCSSVLPSSIINNSKSLYVWFTMLSRTFTEI